MADSKKYNGSTWEHSLRKLGTATDTLTILPADLYADGNNATVGLVGNMSQTGTPTPQNPIQPQECGDLETVGEKAGQYKIPISSGGVTTNIYLGSTQTARRVRKQVVTISRIIESGTPNMKIAIVALDTSLVSPRTALSTVVPYGNPSTPETFYFVNANNIGMVGAVGDTDEQITAKYEGSILYYGIAETTGIVNEPIRKIGDYADTVSGITIPTTAGANSFDVLTTLKPSEVSLAYTGWHDATVEEWDGSQWQ